MNNEDCTLKPYEDPYGIMNGQYCTALGHIKKDVHAIIFELIPGYTFSALRDGSPVRLSSVNGKPAVQYSLVSRESRVLGIYRRNTQSTGKVKVGINEPNSGTFVVYSIQNTDRARNMKPVPVFSSNECSMRFDNDGYYCADHSLPTGAYAVSFSNVVDDHIVIKENGEPVSFSHYRGKPAIGIQLTTSGAVVLGQYSK
ncbi:MAG: hypothetical protein QNJ97_28880 [Myxococcota bacterium]|nr:hypothetical protein [Myxococcota bacterium]